MSKDFYFHKWRESLHHLKELVDMDIQYQVKKVNDPTLPQAVRRLTSVLGQYLLIYNEVIECFQQNLQVQKAIYYDNVVKAVVSRILELKAELEKLENSRFQFIGHSLIEIQHTVFDVEVKSIPKEPGRPEHIQNTLDEILARVKKMKETVVLIVEEKEESANKLNDLWDLEETKEEEPKVKVVEVPEAIRKTREYLAMIMAHEKTRQIIKSVKYDKFKRETWKKELTGCLKPPAKYEVRVKSAELMRKVFRTYFKLKRERIKDCKRDELLGLNLCDTKNIDLQRIKAEEMLRNRSTLQQIYEKQWRARREDLKQQFLKKRRAELCDEFRDNIREWFVEWFETAHFFFDIPKNGSPAIFRAEVPGPEEWLEQNKVLANKNEADKNKNPQDLKFEKKEAKRQEMLVKREEQMKAKAEALLLKKMMKNPSMHPGYYFPISKQTDKLLQVIDYYHESWDSYDKLETLDVKVKFVDRVDVEDIIMEVKLEVLPEADKCMRQELQQLKIALKKDYKAQEEEMPVNFMKPVRKYERNRKKKVKNELSKQEAEMIEELANQGFMIEYPTRKIADFIGDAQFGGEDLRSQILPAFPFNFEIRAYWWERCREVCLGFHKILLVGPKISGKTTLVQAMASVNNAVLFELDPYKVQEYMHEDKQEEIQEDVQCTEFLKRLIHMVATCARALQPSVIHIKHIQKLFYTKIPPEEAEMNLPLLRTFFVQKLMKKIRKTDNITVVGTCTDPWLAKSSNLLRQFPVVLVLPDCTYSLVVQLLKQWVDKNRIIPPNFDVSNLAHVLQGYSFGYLKEALEKFLSADRIVKIAAFGLEPMEVYEFILEDDKDNKVEYDKYLKWYTEKTSPGIKEMKHLKEQKEFQAAVEKFEEKNKKKTKSAASSTTASSTKL